MAEKKTPVPLTSAQLDILLGMLGESELELARKYSGTPEGPERIFYGETLGKLNNLSGLLRKHHPRLHDTSQDVNEDEYDADAIED
jgi:hypothetical protein